MDISDNKIDHYKEYRYDYNDATRRTREKYRNYVVKSLQKRRKKRPPKRFRRSARLSKESFSRTITQPYEDIYGNHFSPTFTYDQRLFFQSSSAWEANVWHDYDCEIYHIIDPVQYGVSTGYRVSETGTAYLASISFPINVSSVGGAPGYDIDFREETEQATLQKALRTFGDPKASLGEFFFEREKTLKMITSKVTAIHKSIVFARHGRFDLAFAAIGLSSKKIAAVRGRHGQLVVNGKDLEKSLKESSDYQVFYSKEPILSDFNRKIANLWLELKYGWSPLLQDCQGVAEFLFDKHHDIEKPASHRACNERLVDEYTYSGLDQPGYTYRKTRTSGLYRCTVVVDGYVSNAASREMNSLGLSNPVNLAWNLLPLSFVADWFVNVDECLGQFSQGFGLTISRISFSHRYDRLMKQFVKKTRSGPTGDSFSINCSVIQNKKRRRISYEIPTYPPRLGNFLSNILSKGEFDLKKSISALSLAIQRIPR